MIKGKLIMRDSNIKIIAQSLEPDNLSEKTILKDDEAIITFSSDKISTILSSVDDYLMNAKIAKEVIEALKNN